MITSNYHLLSTDNMSLSEVLMLDYRVLTFLALYDEMNYRRTAEKLNMTQPGVTQHIHYLENYYGVKLFEYDGRCQEQRMQNG